MFIVGNKSTGIRTRLTTPITVIIRQATIMKCQFRIANRDIISPHLINWRILEETIQTGSRTYFSKIISRHTSGQLDNLGLNQLARSKATLITDNDQVILMQA